MLSWQIAVPECLKGSEPIIRVQVPWRVCERLAAGEGGQEQKEDDVHRLGTAWLADVPHPACDPPGWGFGIALVVVFPRPTLCLDFPSPSEAVTSHSLWASPGRPAWAC